MSSITEALELLDNAVEALRSADWERAGVAERLTGLDELEAALRRGRALSHSVIHSLDEQALGAPVAATVSDVLRITRAEARRRVRDAAQLAHHPSRATAAAGAGVHRDRLARRGARR